MNPDFIEVYENALSPGQCAAFIERFEQRREYSPGHIGSGYFPDMKDSQDLTISGRAGWQDVEAAFNQAVIAGVAQYVRRYRYALLAPLMLAIQDPKTGQQRRIQPEDLDAMPEPQLMQLLFATFRPGFINIQRYTGGKGGYPYWHCEHYPKDAQCETLHRVLLWTIYLNDGFAEGETEFFYQQRKIAPKTGSLLIAPTSFTHTHRGNTPKGGDKYIATSWVLFQRAETLFPKR
jgi:hypothetical protein